MSSVFKNNDSEIIRILKLVFPDDFNWFMLSKKDLISTAQLNP